MNNPEVVPFHGQELNLVERDGELLLVQGMRLDVGTQRQKLKEYEAKFGRDTHSMNAAQKSQWLALLGQR